MDAINHTNLNPGLIAAQHRMCFLNVHSNVCDAGVRDLNSLSNLVNIWAPRAVGALEKILICYSSAYFYSSLS